MRSGTSRPTTRARRQALAFVVVSLCAHGSLLAALGFVQLSRGGSPARIDHDDDPFLMQLTLRATPFLVQSEPEPVAEPIPEPVPEPVAQTEAEPEPEPELPVEVEPELAPEPGPPPPEPPAAVATTTAEEAPAAACSAPEPLAPPKAVPSATPSVELPAVPPPAAPAAPAQAGSGLGALDDGFHLRALRADRPEYPEEARRRNEEGTVTCRLTIDRDGRVIEVEIVLSSGSKALDAAAARVLKRWRFEPLARLTDRTSVHAIQKLTFELKSARR